MKRCFLLIIVLKRCYLLNKSLFQPRDEFKNGVAGTVPKCEPLSAERSTLNYFQFIGRNLYAIDTALLRNFSTPLREQQLMACMQTIRGKYFLYYA